MSISRVSLGPASYASRSAIAVTALAAATFGFPLVAWGLLRATHCGVDTCGAVGLVAAMTLKPVIVLAFLAYLLAISVRRARNAGLPALCGVFVPLMAVADINVMLYVGAGWAYAFSSGVLRLSFPTYLAFSLACICVLCVAPPKSLRLDRSGWLPRVAIALGCLVAALALLRSTISFFPFAIMSLPRPLLFPMGIALRFVVVPMLGLLAALLALAFAPQFAPISNGSETASAASPVAPRRWSLKAAAVVVILFATGLTLAQLGRHGFGMMAVLFLPAYLSLILPTALLYLPAVCALLNLWDRRNAVATGLVLIALLPMASWGLAFESAREARRAELARIAAIPVVPLETMPSSIVTKSYMEHVDCDRLHAAVPGITDIVRVTTFDGHEVLRTTSCENNRRKSLGDWRVIQALPKSFVQMVLGGDEVTFDAPKRTMFAAGGLPVELRYVAPSHNDRLAASYQVFGPEPVFPPLLTAAGWFRGPNEATIEESSARLTDFVIEGLKAATAGQSLR